eukprot:1430629-Rhodomonas_salina.3
MKSETSADAWRRKFREGQGATELGRERVTGGCIGGKDGGRGGKERVRLSEWVREKGDRGWPGQRSLRMMGSWGPWLGILTQRTRTSREGVREV